MSDFIIDELLDLHVLRKEIGDPDVLISSANALGLPGHELANVLRWNTSSNLPYHGIEHLVDVALAANSIYRIEGYPIEFRRSVFVAGLFHDANHTGVGKPDTDNIALAIQFAMTHRKIWNQFADESAVTSLIAATNTDFPVDSMDVKYRYMCDADLMGWLYPDFDARAKGLSEEFGIEVTRKSTLEFIKSHKFTSEHARKALLRTI